jgi:hypothetical protein
MDNNSIRVRKVKTSIVNHQSENVDLEEDDLPYKKSTTNFKQRHLSNSISIPVKSSDDQRSDTIRRWRVEESMLRACISEGMSRDQIKEVMSLNEHGIGVIEKRLLANDGQIALNQSTAHRFYNYTLQQEQCVRDLEYIISMIVAEMEQSRDFSGEGEFNKRLSPQAAIIAIKAKSEILDKVVKTGQDMGIIEKRARELRVSGNLNLATLSTDDLKKTLSDKLDEFQKLVGTGKLPSVYERLIRQKDEQHERAARRGFDGSNLERSIQGNPIRPMEEEED